MADNSTSTSTSNVQTTTFGKQIAFARQKSHFTIHAFAQLMGIKLRLLEDFENDITIPEKKHIAKMNRFLTTSLPYPPKDPSLRT